MQRSINQYILKLIFLLTGAAILTISAAGIVNIRMNRVSFIDEKSAQLNSLLRLHKNELLNEIALSDSVALHHHISILRDEINSDKVILNYEYGTIITEDKVEKPRPNFLIRAFLSLFVDIKPFYFELSNDYGTSFGRIEIHFRNSLHH